jgi:hypothetical protein
MICAESRAHLCADRPAESVYKSARARPLAAEFGQRPLGPRPGLRAFELEMSVNASLAFGAMPLNRASADPAGASPAGNHFDAPLDYAERR